MIAIENPGKMPVSFHQPPPWGSQQADPADGLMGDIDEYYHGTCVSLLPSIIETGFRPTIGAGSDAVYEHFGVIAPGVHVAKTFGTACSYPMISTIVKILGADNVSGVSGGAIIADDSTPPMRAVIRCVANRHTLFRHSFAPTTYTSRTCLFTPSRAS